MAVPGLPNWGYGLYLDPQDMMQRVFGPDKYTRERQKTADTQHAADFGLKQEQMELQKREQAANLLQLVSLMPDGPEKTQLLQQIYGTLGVTQDQPAQAPGYNVPPPREASVGMPPALSSLAETIAGTAKPFMPDTLPPDPAGGPRATGYQGSPVPGGGVIPPNILDMLKNFPVQDLLQGILDPFGQNMPLPETPYTGARGEDMPTIAMPDATQPPQQPLAIGGAMPSVAFGAQLTPEQEAQLQQALQLQLQPIQQQQQQPRQRGRR